MHLQSLELFGFKSFADKTVFHFHEGVTAIVGPNGCGKSNLLDAVRWVLGEQSAKSLRGGEMADVIFNGTDTRKPLGFAEVSLTLTDCAAELGVDWHDVRVTRRVYRDGNSEYFLNKTVCRLRDIQSLFADTGVARSAYSMMEQGKIDLILSSRPEDRRAVFEEAAGITKYKAQKREALRKLEATEANLLRIGDIIKEVKRQIGSLQRQAGKARRYQTLLADLKVLDTHYSRRKLEALEKELRGCRREIERISETERLDRARIEQGENDLSTKRRVLEKADSEIADARAEIEHLQGEIGANRNRIEFNRQRMEETTELITRAKTEIAAAEAKRERQHTEMEQVSALVEKTTVLLRTKRAELAGLTEMAAKFRADRAARETEFQELVLAASKNENRISSLESDLSNLKARREATNEHLHQVEEEISEARTARENAEAGVTAAHEGVKTELENAQALLEAGRTAEETLHVHRESLAETEKQLNEIERALTEKESRLEVLKQLNEEGEGLAHGSQAVLRGLDDPDKIRAALAGALVTQLDVDPKFVAAIEAILGRNLHTIVLQNSEIVPQIIRSLTEKKLGHAALFIPQWTPTTGPSPKKNLPEHALAWAIDTIQSPPALAPLLQHLLQDVAIFADLDHAIGCKTISPQMAVATVDGEFISNAGVVFGGSSSTQSESVLARKGRISILAGEHAALESQRAGLRQRRDEVRVAVEKANRDVDETRTKHREADLAHAASGNKIVLLQRETDEAVRKVENLLSEAATLRQQVV
ncbi:MAG: chromosome segregation protein, partial [Verrucomicrobiota bacterium]